MAAATGGGVLHEPLDCDDLADKLGELLANPQRANELGRRGRAAVHSRFHALAMAEATLGLYRRLGAGDSRRRLGLGHAQQFPANLG
jgi:glycosyltransferase involved in cell wall biosynthesis